MATRPSKKPEWATALSNDPTSLQDNRVEPSAGQKLTGIIRGAFQPRQYTNWLFWLSNKWHEHFDASVNHFDPHEAAAPDMTVVLTAGRVQNGVTVTSVAEQITAAFVAPAGNPRIDRVVIDNVTGVYSVIAGAEAASPVAPALTPGKIAVCQVLLDNSPATTEITNSLITDERARPFSEVASVSDYICSEYPREVTASLTYAKTHEFLATSSGTIRVRQWLKSQAGSTKFAFCKVYLGGVAQGAEHTTNSTSYVEFSDDIVIAKGELIQLYQKTNDAGSDSIAVAAVGDASGYWYPRSKDVLTIP